MGAAAEAAEEWSTSHQTAPKTPSHSKTWDIYFLCLTLDICL